jgi:hypothetical protein
MTDENAPDPEAESEDEPDTEEPDDEEGESPGQSGEAQQAGDKPVT